MTTPPNKTPVTPGRMVIHPLRDFLAKEAASGSLLVVAAAFALGWANSPWNPPTTTCGPRWRAYSSQAMT